MEYWSSVFAMILDWKVLVFLPIGVIVGAIIGAIPGLTITMSISVLLPFTLFLDPLPGLVLIFGISKGGLFGGSISAILLNVPGTPAAACTMLDGYPLSRKGRAGEALDTALWASFLGDLISVLALILLAGALAQLGLKFGPVELFALIVFSLTVIAAISTSGLLRGIVGGLLGLIAGTVGLDLVYGSERFTFGSANLYDGIAFMPLLVGLFALPDILLYYFGPRQARKGVGRTAGGASGRLSMANFRMILPTILKGGFIGVILGAIPGIGATASTFVSYAEARRSAPDREEFGKGALSGVAAAESANSGTGASTLIPLLALGIPGDIVGAMLLGAFYFHGLAPGPLLFQNNLDFIHALYITLLISSAIVLIVGRYGTQYIKRIVEVPRDVLFPIVLVLTVVGAFAISNSLFDVWVMLVAGMVGIGFRALRIPEAAFLIGFVLSPLLENNLQRVLIIGKGEMSAFFDSWIALVLYAATVAAVVGRIILPALQEHKLKRQAG
ncbi:tripartite tricarboxylate transporter permease [Chachezhania sediminis]|uniref:tripartite tricarboxylate transporter permease n=1 Tax=Chachezhania sediminis TaxID=2599291 RepID=UPI00131E29F1|nr:tripartite tricarboxylate transporter permease [Chachezhania sediminis]